MPVPAVPKFHIPDGSSRLKKHLRRTPAANVGNEHAEVVRKACQNLAGYRDWKLLI